MENVAILVLAAGKSSRIKSIKQLERINSKTLLDITLEKAKAITSDNLFCVLGANKNTIKKTINSKNVQFVYNENFECGLSASIIAGIQYFNKNKLNFEGVLILLADQPAIDIAYLKSLLTLFQSNKDTIIASNYRNNLGVPAIFPKKYFAALFSIKGDKGAKDFINEKKEEVLCPESTTNLFDIDTKEDLRLFKNSILK